MNSSKKDEIVVNNDVKLEMKSYFLNFSGPFQIAVLCMLYALSLGSTVGIVPAMMTDRFARNIHGLNSTEDCSYFVGENKPVECKYGSQDAQNASAESYLISNILTFFSSATVGSISDRHGRKMIMILGCILGLIGPIMLVLMQLDSTLSPFWYYSGRSIDGLVSWMAIAQSSLSDVIPKEFRAASFALLSAGFSLGFAFSPAVSLCFDSHLETCFASLFFMLLALVINIFFMPETLQNVNNSSLEKETSSSSCLLRPFREMSILNRDILFRLLSGLAFFSGIVGAADQSLLVYYVEDRLDFNDVDISKMFVFMGICGILVNCFLIKRLIDIMGERLVLVVAFSAGTITNLLYGLSKTKMMIFIALPFSSLGWMSFPTISAIKANNVNEFEQGRIQGALFSLQALAFGIGPVLLRFFYNHTKDYSPGSMFICAAIIELLPVGFAYLLPKDRANTKLSQYSSIDEETFNTENSSTEYSSVEIAEGITIEQPFDEILMEQKDETTSTLFDCTQQINQ